jgi:cytochrome c oxidase assembly factor CtaG
MNTEQFLLSAWTWNPVILAVAVAGLAGYLFAFRAERRFGWFLLALVLFVFTLVSPLNALADGYLFSAHMIQHIVLLLIVPALFLSSLPRHLSLTWRPRILAHPLAGWIVGVGAMWFWHWPALCNAAVTSPSIYAMQTASLLILGILFWSQVMAPREEERLSPPGAILYLFSACVSCSVLGIILTFSPVAVCSIYAMPVGDRLGMWETIRAGWGFTPEKDQQIGGLLMWVPMCFIYLGAIFAQITRWFGEAPAAPSVAQRL